MGQKLPLIKSTQNTHNTQQYYNTNSMNQSQEITKTQTTMSHSIQVSGGSIDPHVGGPMDPPWCQRTH